MNIEDIAPELDFGRYAIYANGKPVAYASKYAGKVKHIDIPFIESHLFKDEAKALIFQDSLIKQALKTDGGSLTFTLNHVKGKIKQINVSGYKRVNIL